MRTRRWTATDRDTDTLERAVLAEVYQMNGNAATDPGPASLELAVRAAYPLVVSGMLNRGPRHLR